MDQNLGRHGGTHFNLRTLKAEAGGSGDQDHLGYREFKASLRYMRLMNLLHPLSSVHPALMSEVASVSLFLQKYLFHLHLLSVLKLEPTSLHILGMLSVRAVSTTSLPF